MERLDFAVQLRYWRDKLGMTDGDIAEVCKVSPKTVSRWINHHSAPHKLGRQPIIDQLRMMEPITKENLNEHVKAYLKEHLRLVFDDSFPGCYYEGDPITINAKVMLDDDLITEDWFSVYP